MWDRHGSFARRDTSPGRKLGTPLAIGRVVFKLTGEETNGSGETAKWK